MSEMSRVGTQARASGVSGVSCKHQSRWCSQLLTVLCHTTKAGVPGEQSSAHVDFFLEILKARGGGRGE